MSGTSIKMSSLKVRQAFTLVEIALALAVLTIGLTAVTTVYLTALRWAAETRHQYTAIDTAHQVLRDPALLSKDREGLQAISDFNDPLRGWLNGFYVIRERGDGESYLTVGGTEVARSYEVRVSIYAGGTDADGMLVSVIDSVDLVRRP